MHILEYMILNELIMHVGNTRYNFNSIRLRDRTIELFSDMNTDSRRCWDAYCLNNKKSFNWAVELNFDQRQLTIKRDDTPLITLSGKFDYDGLYGELSGFIAGVKGYAV